MKKPIRVIQWGTGYTGAYSLRFLFDNPRIEVVGVKCFTSDKEGQDAGEIAGIGPRGIRATRDREALLALDADCVVFMPKDLLDDPSLPDSLSKPWVDDLMAILESKKNVITSLCAGTHWRHLARGEEFRDRLNAACRKGASTVHFSGFDPGFTTDALAYTLASVVGRIQQIRTWEIIDVSTYTAVSTLQQLGFGANPQDLPADGARAIVNGWGGAVHLLGESLGVSVEKLDVDFDVWLSPDTFRTQGGLTVPAGTIAAIRWSMSGNVDHAARFVINHVTRARHESAPDWPRIGTDGGYRVEIDGFPPLRADFPMGLPSGTGSTFADAMAMTAARCVNSIAAVVNAPVGYHNFLSLRPLGGEFAFQA